MYRPFSRRNFPRLHSSRALSPLSASGRLPAVKARWPGRRSPRTTLLAHLPRQRARLHGASARPPGASASATLILSTASHADTWAAPRRAAVHAARPPHLPLPARVPRVVHGDAHCDGRPPVRGGAPPALRALRAPTDARARAFPSLRILALRSCRPGTTAWDNARESERGLSARDLPPELAAGLAREDDVERLWEPTSVCVRPALRRFRKEGG
ncbi:uncharacterized protein BXZ73DRAFT_85825, partial [Epithele typhae]|uniref:uncharacterized protein n=1 Tax=Epithele typhae TaxID=378194 RepID=UPI002007517C